MFNKMVITVVFLLIGIEVRTGTNSVHRTVPILGLHQINQGTCTCMCSDYVCFTCLIQEVVLLYMEILTVLIQHTYNQVMILLILSSSIYTYMYMYTHVSDCFWLLDELIQFSTRGLLPVFVSPALSLTPPVFLPEKMEGTCQYCKV